MRDERPADECNEHQPCGSPCEPGTGRLVTEQPSRDKPHTGGPDKTKSVDVHGSPIARRDFTRSCLQGHAASRSVPDHSTGRSHVACVGSHPPSRHASPSTQSQSHVHDPEMPEAESYVPRHTTGGVQTISGMQPKHPMSRRIGSQTTGPPRASQSARRRQRSLRPANPVAPRQVFWVHTSAHRHWLSRRQER